MLLDISMPVLDGFNVLDIISENGIDIPIVLVTAEATAANVQRAAKYSIAGFISKPFEPRVILEKLGKIFDVDSVSAVEKTQNNKFDKSETDETETYISKLTAIYKTYLRNIDLDDSHYSRISKLMEIMLIEYGLTNKAELDTLDIRIISRAAYFHDIGLMGIPSELISRRVTLKDTELDIYNSHTNMGANIIWLNNAESCKFFVKVCADMCMHHHERYDGTGFPHGLKGADNSINSQLCGLAIRFDKMLISRKEINDVQFDFFINELRFDRGAFSAELIELLSACKREILNYYKVMQKNNDLVLV